MRKKGNRVSDISDEQRTIVAAVLDEQYFLAREGPGIRVFEVWMRKEPEKKACPVCGVGRGYVRLPGSYDRVICPECASDEVNEWEVWIR